MKKKFFGVVIIAAIALAAGWNFNQSKHEMFLSDLALANVEALAYGEESTMPECVSIGCRFNPSWDCFGFSNGVPVNCYYRRGQ